MTHREQLIRERWAEFLARDDIVGAYIFFHEGCEYVARIKSTKDVGDKVIFYLACCARKTRLGWTSKKRALVTCAKVRIEFVSANRPVVFGGFRMHLRDFEPFDESVIVAPKTRTEQKEAKQKAKSGGDPGPLFAAVQK